GSDGELPAVEASPRSPSVQPLPPDARTRPAPYSEDAVAVVHAGLARGPDDGRLGLRPRNRDIDHARNSRDIPDHIAGQPDPAAGGPGAGLAAACRRYDGLVRPPVSDSKRRCRRVTGRSPVPSSGVPRLW